MAAAIVVVGSSNIDLVMKMPRLPKVGETVTDATFVQAFGGKGANQAVGAARAGGDVAFVGCVGDDAYGGQVIENLQADGIDTRFVFAETGVASGTALIMVGRRGPELHRGGPRGELPPDPRARGPRARGPRAGRRSSRRSARSRRRRSTT